MLVAQLPGLPPTAVGVPAAQRASTALQQACRGRPARVAACCRQQPAIEVNAVGRTVQPRLPQCRQVEQVARRVFPVAQGQRSGAAVDCGATLWHFRLFPAQQAVVVPPLAVGMLRCPHGVL